MKILNAKICSNGQIFDGEVTVDGERIASVTPKETSSSSDETIIDAKGMYVICLLYTSPSPRDRQKSRMPSSA